jgi:hypothetical protein
MERNIHNNFNRETLKAIFDEHNLAVKQNELMPHLNMDDPKIRASVERGRKLAMKIHEKERKQFQKAIKESEKWT